MSIKYKYEVRSIDPILSHDWILNKHYAHRIPTIIYAFGLYDIGGIMQGACTFGPPPRAMNNGDSIFTAYTVKTIELNRLIINEGLEKNVLSFFVSECLRSLPTPMCVVSYADYTFGHNGYIYQATNWIYTGLNQIHEREWFLNGEETHQRTLSGMGLTSAKKKIEAGLTHGDYTKKHRYLKFLGNKKEIKVMRDSLTYEILPYPKGNNKRYDASYKPSVQGILF